MITYFLSKHRRSWTTGTTADVKLSVQATVIILQEYMYTFNADYLSIPPIRWCCLFIHDISLKWVCVCISNHNKLISLVYFINTKYISTRQLITKTVSFTKRNIYFNSPQVSTKRVGISLVAFNTDIFTHSKQIVPYSALLVQQFSKNYHIYQRHFHWRWRYNHCPKGVNKGIHGAPALEYADWIICGSPLLSDCFITPGRG